MGCPGNAGLTIQVVSNKPNFSASVEKVGLNLCGTGF